MDKRQRETQRKHDEINQEITELKIGGRINTCKEKEKKYVDKEHVKKNIYKKRKNLHKLHSTESQRLRGAN